MGENSILDKNNKAIGNTNSYNEERVLEENHLLKAVLESIGDAVYFTDSDLKIKYWNKASTEITGFSREKMIGAYCRDVLKHQDDQGTILCDDFCPLKQSLSEQRDFFNEVWCNTANGFLLPIELRCSPIKNSQGITIGAVEVFRDRTKHKELEKMKEDFLTTITHDLKAPLSSMMGFTELLLDSDSSLKEENIKDYLKNIKRSGKFLLVLINNIISSSQLKSEKSNYYFENILVSDIYKDLADTFEPHFIEKKIEFQWNCQPNTWIYADNMKVTQIFHNLVSNAIRYTPQKGTIKINTSSNNDRVLFVVSDNGSGIEKDKLNLLTDKFSTKLDSKSDSGLGLYITAKFLEAHGSKLTIESKKNMGSKFYFDLAKGNPIVSIPDYKGNILLAAEERYSLIPESTYLEEAGHSLDRVYNGFDAILKLHSENYDLVIIYPPLPDMLVEEFRQLIVNSYKCQKTPIILLSTIRRPDWEERFAKVILIPSKKEVLLQEAGKLMLNTLDTITY